MELLVRVAALAMIAAVIGLVVKKSSPEMTLLLAVAAAVFTIFMVAGALSDVIAFAESLADTAGLPAAVPAIVLKTVGIGILARLSADVCRDAGQQALASAIELTAAVAALVIALPLMQTLLDMIQTLI